jgi:hypothetical protein
MAIEKQAGIEPNEIHLPTMCDSDKYEKDETKD